MKGITPDRQDILFVSPRPFSEETVDLSKIESKATYQAIYASNNQSALDIIDRDLPAIIIVNIFMDDYSRSIHKSFNLINDFRAKEFNALIVGTSTIPLDDISISRIIGAGANLYTHAEMLKHQLPKIVSHYETIMLADKDFLESHPNIKPKVRKSTLYINHQYLKTFFKRNPGVNSIKLDPWRMNLQTSKRKSPADDCLYCFEFLRQEIS